MTELGRGLVLIAIAVVGCGGSDDTKSNGKPPEDAGADSKKNGDASPAVCGNGVVEDGEACDEGAANGSGGCKTDCTPTCTLDAECDDQKPCNGTEICEASGTGRACKPGTPPSDGASCGAIGYCKAGECAEPVCGNGELEPGEACEPPNAGSCSAACEVCGDGVIGDGEDCDDGGLDNLDGCDATCRYEVVMRFSQFEYTTIPGPSFCVHPGNAFGVSLATEIAGALNQGLNTATDGALNNMILGFDGLDDLTGQNDSSVQLAMMNGSVDPRYTWKPGAIDAWFLAFPNSIDASGKPAANKLFGAGSIKNGILDVGPGDFLVQSTFNITPYDLFSRDTTIRARIDAFVDVPAAPPDQLAAGKKVFESIDATAAGEGLCAALTAGSLVQGNIPQDFALGQYACQENCTDSHAYTYCGAGQPVGPNCNSWLDILVGGCKVSALCIPAIKPTQPDVGSDGKPPEPIVLGPNNKAIVTNPTDAYSIYMRFKATRAHFTNNY